MSMHVQHLIAHTYIGCHPHDHWFVPGPPLPKMPILPHIAVDTLLGLTIKAKYSTTVSGPLGIPAVGAGNDSGLLVPHFGIPLNNGLVPLHIVFGSSKPMFAASTVQMECQGSATPTAAGMIPYAPVSMNQACCDPLNLPFDIVISPTNVLVGLTAGDYVAGVVSIVLDSAISGLVNFAAGKASDRLASAIAGPAARTAGQSLARRAGSEATERFFREASEATMKSAGKVIGDTVANLGKEVVSLGTDPLNEWVSGLARDAVDGPLPPAEGSTPVHSLD